MGTTLQDTTADYDRSLLSKPIASTLKHQNTTTLNSKKTVRAKEEWEQQQPSAPRGKREEPDACDGNESA